MEGQLLLLVLSRKKMEIITYRGRKAKTGQIYGAEEGH